MADPGTAVGMISLGIQVCLGLVKYYKAWEGQDQYVQETLNNLDREAKVLELLQRNLRRLPISAGTSAQQVEECIVHARGPFNRLKVLLENCQTVPAPGNFKRKGRNAARSALFPFRKETLRDMRAAVVDAERVTRFAVQILSL